MRVMGIDPGSRRIGLALSDEDGVLASPLVVIEGGSGEDAARRVLAEARRHGAATLVLGLPLRLDGSEGDEARRVRRFARHLEAGGGRVVLWDERLSSVAAERALAARGLRAHKRRGVVDKAAAAIILQSYLDAEAAGERSDT